MKKLYLLPLLLSLALASCEEDKGDPAPKPEPEVKAVPFNFRFDPRPEDTKELELIVSQKDGKVLLDTLIAARTNHALVVESADTELDVTTAYLNPSTQRVEIRTYIQVNPDNWHIDERLSFWVHGKSERTYINYSNIPYHTSAVFSGKQITEWGSSYDSYKGSFQIQYDRKFLQDMSYLLLPEWGKYIFAEVNSPETQVDFSKASTAVKHSFNLPSSARSTFSEVFGFMKAGDYGQTMLLYFGPGDPEGKFDLLYPPTLIEEFQVHVTYEAPGGFTHSYYHVGASIPTDIGFLANPDFTVTKPYFNDFQIEFAEDKPCTYKMAWYSDSLNARWQIYLSPGQENFQPGVFIHSLSNGYLAGKNLSGFTLEQISTYKAKDHTHQSMLDYYNNPEAYRGREVRRYREISKSFL